MKNQFYGNVQKTSLLFLLKGETNFRVIDEN